MHNIRTLRFVAIMVAGLLGVAKISAAPFGLWNFDSGNLTATVGADLQYTEGPGGATDLSTAFGTTTSFSIANINATPAAVMKYPAATNGMGYLIPTPAANGRGSFVDNYTLILDVLFPAGSDGKIRPILETDGGTFTPDADLGVSAANGIGIIGGTSFGTIVPNTWYRIGFVVATSNATMYIDGTKVGSQTLTGTQKDRLVLSPNSTALLLANTGTNQAAPGYVNSIQLLDSALNAGQMAALGAASASGIPQTIPPVPSYIVDRSPGSGATGVVPTPAISVLLDQGATTVTPSSVILKLDGVQVGTLTATPPTYAVNYTPPAAFDPLSVHTLQFTWTDSVIGAQTNTWSFTVQNYQVIKLPAPFYFENFDSVAEGAMPAGWYATNRTETDVPGLSFINPRSDTYKDWVVITTNTLFTAKGGDPLIVPPIQVNGSFLTAMANNQLCYAESDSRNGSQVQMLFATNINCTGRANVYLSFHSIYEQNQDSSGSVEYSVDGGATWLPGIYMLDDENQTADVIRTNGVIDVGATFLTERGDQAYGSNYAQWIGAPVSAALIPFVSGRINDDNVESIRVEVIRLTQADNKPNVSLRFAQSGTGSWWFAIDEVGLYEINAPVISVQPASQVKDAGTSVTFSVTAGGTPAPTYQWQSNNVNIAGATSSSLTFTAEPSLAANYRVVVSNIFGVLNSAQASLTVIAAPRILQDPVSASVNAGVGVAFNVDARGRAPITYQWTKNGSPIGGQTAKQYVIGNAQLANIGQYACVVSNPDAVVTTRAADLKVVTGIAQDLVVHLKFDGDYNDSSGRANNGTAVGSPGFGAGKIGNAMQWTEPQGQSETNYVTLGMPADLHMGNSNSFSISFWYKLPAGQRAGDPAIISNKDWDSGSNLGFVLFNSGSGLRWNYRELDDTVNSNTRKDSGATSPGIEDGNWHHCVVVFNRLGNAATYVDGNLVNVAPLATGAPAAFGGVFPITTIDNDPPTNRTATATGAWNIGEDGSGWYGFHDNVGVTNALVDDLGIWRRALTPGEVKAIYTAGNAGNSLETAAPVASSNPLNPSIAISAGNAVITKGNTMLFSAPSLSGPWAEVTAARSVSVYSEPLGTTKFYRGAQP